ncbi:carboxymethylenebutenolidase [Fusarium odoratissimum NRRL 54006]|uniref:Carboxymethylenebutenolidase n=1 Tax=Fusarium odoratissimum (strain NRRL 54006) TaxID=1089451 RepID=X0J2L0_FUSO5|nr:carboxymethylenebutenolidase [Fusarium odoratissimum NRRL 54006]EXL90510.1 carboxymethylenebutenolidase [Fusarium odoratissimum NRRL 54006]
MYADISKPPTPLPSIKLEVLRPGLSLLWPLSRRGHGPGLIILSTTSEDPVAFYDGVPSSLVKWAEEGYAVVQIEAAAFEGKESGVVLREAIDALRQCDKCELDDKDQGTALRQLGLMPEYLPFPYPVPNAAGGPGTKYEYRVPMAGIEAATKMRDRNGVPSNEMFNFKVGEVQNGSKTRKTEVLIENVENITTDSVV